jgi:DMSO/TMAO reductase YedYZ molybdopterin-dependent catalytic subunit
MSKLLIDGEVRQPVSWTAANLAAIHAAHQISDIGRFDAKRSGRAVRLAGILSVVGEKPAARWLTLYSSRDNFHASIPLAAVRDRAMIVYERDGQPLGEQSGGPFRFFIPDHANCHTADVDECANVKFVDRIELSAERGPDNRPTSEAEHARLHRS